MERFDSLEKVVALFEKADKKKYCLTANVDEPLLPYHKDNLARFIKAFE